MPGGCWVCNPVCGKCKPAAARSGRCPSCGERTVFMRAAIMEAGPLACKKCGEDLAAIVRPAPISCNFSGLPCAYPCGKGAGSKPTLGYQPCASNTPPEGGVGACGM